MCYSRCFYHYYYYYYEWFKEPFGTRFGISFSTKSKKPSSRYELITTEREPIARETRILIGEPRKIARKNVTRRRCDILIKHTRVFIAAIRELINRERDHIGEPVRGCWR